MNKLLKTSIAIAMLALAPFAYACDYPKKAELPDGATASKEEMLAGQSSVKAYMAAMETYLACIEKEEQDTLATMTDITEEESATRDAALTKKYNAAVAEMELIAAQFNEQVRAYKAQSE